MRQSTGQISRFGTLKSLLQRFAFLSLVGLTFALMLIGKADTVLVERARVAVTDAVTPILRVMSEPASVISTAFRYNKLRIELDLILFIAFNCFGSS